MTAIWRANILSWKSESCAKTLRSAICVSLHHAVEVRRGRKWSRVLFENGCPIRDTGKNSQPNGKLRHCVIESQCHSHFIELSDRSLRHRDVSMAMTSCCQ